MAVINIESVESVINLSPSISIREILDLDRVHNQVLGGEPFALYISSYINGYYYSVISARYFETLEDAREAMNVTLEMWKSNPHRIIKTKV